MTNGEKLKELGRVLIPTPGDRLDLENAILMQLKDSEMTRDHLVDMAVAQAEAEPRKYQCNSNVFDVPESIELLKTCKMFYGFCTETMFTLSSDTIKRPIYIVQNGEITSYPPHAGQPTEQDIVVVNDGHGHRFGTETGKSKYFINLKL